jgi:hypothetical protein
MFLAQLPEEEKRNLLIANYPKGFPINAGAADKDRRMISSKKQGLLEGRKARGAGGPIARTGLKKKLDTGNRRIGNTKPKALGGEMMVGGGGGRRGASGGWKVRAMVQAAIVAALVAGATPQIAEAEEEAAAVEPVANVEAEANAEANANASTPPDASMVAAPEPAAGVQKGKATFFFPVLGAAVTYFAGSKKAEKRGPRSPYVPPTPSRPSPKSARLVSTAASPPSKKKASFSMKNVRTPRVAKSGLKKKRAPTPRKSGGVAKTNKPAQFASFDAPSRNNASLTSASASVQGTSLDSAPVGIAFAGTTLSRGTGGARRTGRQSLLGLSVATHAQGGRGKIRKKPLGGSGAPKKGKAKRGASQSEKVKKAVKKSVVKPKTVKTAPAFPTSPPTKKRSTNRTPKPTASKAKATKSRKSKTVKVTRKRLGGTGTGTGSSSSSSLGLLGASVFAALAIISGSSGVAAPAKKAPSNDLGINFAELTSDTGSTTVKTAAKSAPSVAADSEITTQKVAIEKVKKKSAKASQAKKASTVTKKDSVKVASQKNALKKKATANQEKQKKLQKQSAGRRDEINREANRRDLARKAATKKILASRAKAKKAAITKQAKFNPNSLKKKKESGVNPAAFIFAAIGGAVGLTLLSGNDNSSKSKDATGSATANGAAEGANVTEAKNWVQRWRSRGTNKKEASSSPSAPGLPPIDPTADTKAAAAEEKEVAPSDTPTIE